jgi:hypothetical protein
MAQFALSITQGTAAPAPNPRCCSVFIREMEFELNIRKVIKCTLIINYNRKEEESLITFYFFHFLLYSFDLTRLELTLPC